MLPAVKVRAKFVYVASSHSSSSSSRCRFKKSILFYVFKYCNIFLIIYYLFNIFILLISFIFLGPFKVLPA